MNKLLHLIPTSHETGVLTAMLRPREMVYGVSMSSSVWYRRGGNARHRAVISLSRLGEQQNRIQLFLVHLHSMYFLCVNFNFQNPLHGLGGVALSK